MRLMLKLSTSARFQTRVADVEDESSWSKEYDLTTVENAEKYWNALENTFKGKAEMDHAMPSPNLTLTFSKSGLGPNWMVRFDAVITRSQ